MNQHGVAILLNNGTGGFTAGATYVVGTNPQSVAVGDFDGNGKNDLAVVNQGSGAVSILLGNGDGTFAIGVSYTSGINPRMVLAGDFNADGKRDLVLNPSGDTPCAIAGNSVVCSIGNLGPLSRRNLTGALVKIVVQVSAAPGTVLTDNATISSANPDGNLRNNGCSLSTTVTR